MLAVTVLFAPGLLVFLLLAAALECYLLKRPEEEAARAAGREPAPPAAEPQPPARPDPAPAPFPIPAHLPSPSGITHPARRRDQAGD